MGNDIHIPIIRIRMGRYLYLLISILLLIVIRPFLTGFIGLSLLMKIFLTVVLISAVYAAGGEKRFFIPALFLAILTAITRWVDYVFPHISLAVLEELFALLFFGYMVMIILAHLFKEKEVTFDLIIGSICGYFLLGFLWASIYALLELSQPGSFQAPEAIAVDRSVLYYYSFVTLTTLGYGDITPISQPVRSFSSLQAIAGQLYMAILVARLVGVHIAQSQKR